MTLSACGDDGDVSSAMDGGVDGSATLDGASEDAAFDGASPEPDAAPAAGGDASTDASVPDARTDSGDAAGGSADDAAMDADVRALDASADAAPDGAGSVDPDALAVDIDYQMRCLDCEPTAADSPARRIHTGVSGPDVMLECEVIQHATQRLVSFSIGHTHPAHPEQDFSLSILDARDGADPGPQCQVRVREGINEYRGSCKGVGSTSSHPCQVQLAIDGADLTGSAHCERIQHNMVSTLFRYVVASGTANDPATFALRNCVVPDAGVWNDGGM